MSASYKFTRLGDLRDDLKKGYDKLCLISTEYAYSVVLEERMLFQKKCYDNLLKILKPYSSDAFIPNLVFDNWDKLKNSNGFKAMIHRGGEYFDITKKVEEQIKEEVYLEEYRIIIKTPSREKFDEDNINFDATYAIPDELDSNLIFHIWGK